MANGVIYVNKSNLTVPVWKDLWTWDNPSNQIGVIYPREVFAAYPTYGDGRGVPILFLNSQGQLTYGAIDNLAPYFDDDEVYWAFFTGIGDYPYGRVYINGKWYITFKFRRTENVYTAAKRYWGQVAAGMRVACLDTTEFFKSGSGQENPHWKAINYVERSTDGAWIKVSGDGYDYGFVDIGLDHGSGPSKISMYGSW